MQKNRWLRGVLLTAALVAVALAVSGTAGAADSASVSRQDAIVRLRNTRDSVDRTLALIKAGHAAAALKKRRTATSTTSSSSRSRCGSPTTRLTHRRRVAVRRDPRADPRRRAGRRDPRRDRRAARPLDDAERKLTDAGVGAPALVAGQSFLIIFREGFEVVLLLSVLLGYLEAAKSAAVHQADPRAASALAAVATVLTVFLMPAVFACCPVGREVLEAITALLAVAVLFYVSFWLIARLEQQALDGVRARPAVERGVGRLDRVARARRLHRGLPRGLRDARSSTRRCSSFGDGLGVLDPAGRRRSALVALAVVAWLIFRLGRQAAGQDVHEHRGGAADGHVGRVPRQRRRTRCRPPT